MSRRRKTYLHLLLVAAVLLGIAFAFQALARNRPRNPETAKAFRLLERVADGRATFQELFHGHYHRALSTVASDPEAALAVPVIRRLQDHREPSIRIAASQALHELREIGDDEVAVVYATLVVETKGVIGAQELRRMGPKAKAAVPTLAQFVKEAKADFSRDIVVSLLGDIGSAAESVVPDILARLKQGDQLRGDTAKVIAKLLPKEKAADVIVQLIIDSERGSAAYHEAFEHIGPPAVPALVRLLEVLGKREQTQSNVNLLRSVVEIVGEMGPPASPARRSVQTLLTHPKSIIRAGAADTLRWIGPAEAGDRRALEDDLRAALKDNDAKVREKAAMAIGRTGAENRETFAALDSLLSDKNANVVTAADAALRKLEPKRPR